MIAPIALPPPIDWAAEPNAEQVVLLRGKLKARTEVRETIEALEQLADQGSVLSMRLIASAYDQGLLPDPNAELSRYWYQRAIDRGSAHAAYDLGSIFSKVRIILKPSNYLDVQLLLAIHRA